MPKRLDLVLTEEQKKDLARAIREGDICYQRLKHGCGFIGNSFHKVGGNWTRRTHCPQCGEKLK